MKAHKSILSFILVIAMLFSLAVPAFSAETGAQVILTDISGLSTVEKNAINTLVSRGIINGYEDGTYRPAQNITRAEFCVVITKFKGMGNVTYQDAVTGFEDLDTDENYAWARSYVKTAVDMGIVSGFEDGTFRANDQVTYEQAIKMIVCALGYESLALTKMTEGDWSSGYMRQAVELRITNNTTGVSNKQAAASRVTVAMLLSNALNVTPLADVGPSTDGPVVGTGTNNGMPSNWDEVLGKTEVKGIVTGTFVTELYSGVSYVPRDHIMIGTDIYEVGFVQNPNDFLGCRVEATIVKANEYGDYPVCESLKLQGSVITVDAECLEEIVYDGSGVATVSYTTSRSSSNTRSVKLKDDAVVIYNGKYYEYNLENLKNDLTCGTIDLIDNDNDNRYDVVRVNSYKVYVVDSTPTRNSQSIKIMYGDNGQSGETLEFPESSTSVIFSLTLSNGQELELTSLRKWDAITVKSSPEDAEGRRYYEAVVTRNTVSGTITGREDSDETYIEIDGKDFYMSKEFVAYEDEDKPALNVGDYAQVYLDSMGRVVAAAEAKNNNSVETYAYLLGLRQNSDNSKYDLELWLLTTSGTQIYVGTADRVYIDGVRYNANNSKVLDVLEASAQEANSEYANAINVIYQQPIRYQTNSAGLVSNIYTVNSEDNEYISKLVDSGTKYVPSAERKYVSSSKSFSDFKVSSSTKIIFVPDNRSATDDYLAYTSYSKAFTNSRSYYVEAYGLSSSKTAALVLLYGQNDSRIFTSSSPFMIVSGKSTTKDGTILRGYNGTSYTERTVVVSEDNGPSVSNISKGDVIRYILDSNNELIAYELWFDASDPKQLEPCSNVTDAIASRILEIHSTSTDPRTNYPSATFRLQYGTVTEMVLSNGDDRIDEETITVVPTIIEDDMDMVYDGNGVVTRTIGSSVKVFYYDRNNRNANVETDASLEDILPYIDYGEGATRVITYSASGTLRMIYIIAE